MQVAMIFQVSIDEQQLIQVKVFAATCTIHDTLGDSPLMDYYVTLSYIPANTAVADKNNNKTNHIYTLHTIQQY